MSGLPDRPPPYGTICFDCDSTLSEIEGVEALAGPEHVAQIELLTRRAMDGEIALEQVWGRRLSLVKPTRADVQRVGALYVEHAVPNAAALIAALCALGKRVRIVSGGLLPAVRILAEAFGLGADDVQAVDVHFAADGSYAGFEEDSALAQSGGKLAILERMSRQDPKGVAFIGDGITDLEAAPAVARFIAYSGVVRRAAVVDAARVLAPRRDLAALGPLLLERAEIERLSEMPAHRALVRAFEALP